MAAAARSLIVILRQFRLPSNMYCERAFATMVTEIDRMHVYLLTPAAFTVCPPSKARLLALTERHLPSIFAFPRVSRMRRAHVYGTALSDQFDAGRLLRSQDCWRGTNPSDIPVAHQTVINLKTASFW